MQEAVQFSEFLRPVALPSDKEQNFEGTQAIAAGWGNFFLTKLLHPTCRNVISLTLPLNKLFFSGLTCSNVSDCASKHLSDVPLSVTVTVTNCSDSLHNPEYLTNSMLCAGDDGRDSCEGDSGGNKLLLRNLGVISY